MMLTSGRGCCCWCLSGEMEGQMKVESSPSKEHRPWRHLPSVPSQSALSEDGASGGRWSCHVCSTRSDEWHSLGTSQELHGSWRWPQNRCDRGHSASFSGRPLGCQFECQSALKCHGGWPNRQLSQLVWFSWWSDIFFPLHRKSNISNLTFNILTNRLSFYKIINTFIMCVHFIVL